MFRNDKEVGVLIYETAFTPGPNYASVEEVLGENKR
jgi:hypothetical protein